MFEKKEQTACAARSCRNYSDLDVYFSNGEVHALCSRHAHMCEDLFYVDRTVWRHDNERINILMEGTTDAN